MSSLAWLVYLANVLPALASVIGGISTTMLIVTVAAFCFWSFASFMDLSLDSLNSSPFVLTAVVSTVFVVISTLIPSKETIYTIAALKGAEVVVETEYGQELLTDVQEVIKYQLKELKSDSSE